MQMDQNSPEMFVYNLEIFQPSLRPVLQQAFIPSVACCNYNIKETILSSKHYLFDWYDKQAVLILVAALHLWWLFYTMTDAYLDDMGAWKLINNAVDGEFHSNAARADGVLKSVLTIQIHTLNVNLTGDLNCGTKLYLVCTAVRAFLFIVLFMFCILSNCFYVYIIYCFVKCLYFLCLPRVNNISWSKTLKMNVLWYRLWTNLDFFSFVFALLKYFIFTSERGCC